MKLSDISIHAFLQEYQIKTESGVPLSLKDHLFMFEVYSDLSPIQAIMKGAQITASTCFSVKVPWVVKNVGLDAIYTLPTETDRNAFVGGKVNRMIAQNPILQEWTKDKDSIEQKQIGEHLIHYRGTFTSKAAIMIPSDLNVYDEIDASKQSVIEQYATRLQHSKFQWEWYLSHPSAEGFGIHRIFEKSDQKHWFVKCSHCQKSQYLSWSLTDQSEMSIDLDKKKFICKHCKGEIYDEDRRVGYYVKKYRDRDISGYWIPLLICPWVSAEQIVGYFHNKSEEYFYNKVLGLPYIGRGNKLTRKLLKQNLTNQLITPADDERVVIGIDTGLKIDYVMGGRNGLFFNGECEDYTELDSHMKRWPRAIAIIDGGGDLIGSRQFQERWKGRVYICYLTGDKKGTDEPDWKDDERMVTVDRNKYIQITVDEFSKSLIPLQGTEADWSDYFDDWNNLTRVKIFDSITGQHVGYKWIRSGRDHKALATVFYRVGMTKFGEMGEIFTPGSVLDMKSSPEIAPNKTIPAPDPKTIFKFESEDEEYDWRNT